MNPESGMTPVRFLNQTHVSTVLQRAKANLKDDGYENGHENKSSLCEQI